MRLTRLAFSFFGRTEMSLRLFMAWHSGQENDLRRGARLRTGLRGARHMVRCQEDTDFIAW